MSGVWLGMLCAVCIAVANFTGGLASRKDDSTTVAFVGQLVGLPILLPLLFVVPPHHVQATDIAWGFLAGVFQIVGLSLLFRALSVGAMGLLNAATAFTAAVVPAAWASVWRSGLGVVGWIGAAIGLVAIALVARRPGDERSIAQHRTQALEATAAGTLFGLAFVCLALPAKTSSVVPLLTMRVSASAAGAVLLVTKGTRAWISRDNRRLSLLSGVFGCVSQVAFVASAHLNVVAVTAVIQSLAPLGTAALAYWFLGQRLRQLQITGFVLASIATVLLAID